MSGSRDPIRDYLRWRKHEDRVAAVYHWLAWAMIGLSALVMGVVIWAALAVAFTL